MASCLPIGVHLVHLDARDHEPIGVYRCAALALAVVITPRITIASANVIVVAPASSVATPAVGIRSIVSDRRGR